MKYRIKSVRHNGWMTPEEQTVTVSEQIPSTQETTPPSQDYIPDEEPTIELPEADGEIYEPQDELYELPTEDNDDTVIFTPSAIPPMYEQPNPSAEKKPLIPFLKTTESKIIAGVIGGFALLLIVFVIVAIVLSSAGKGKQNQVDGENNTDCTHSYQTIISTQATCTEKGVTTEICSLCDYVKSETYVDPLGHKWKKDESNSVEATCDKEGKDIQICERCSEKETTVLQPLEHDWDEDYSNQATCEDDGTVVKECKLCGKTETEKQQAKGHTWIETSTTQATCAKEGKISFRCTNCSETKDETTAKKDHEMSAPVRTEPTCSKEGKEVVKCKVCGEEKITTIAKLPHNTEPATCESGEKCKVCGEVVSLPLNHQYENGLCTGCGQVRPFTGDRANYITVGNTGELIPNTLHFTVSGWEISEGKVVFDIDFLCMYQELSPGDYLSVVYPDGTVAEYDGIAWMRNETGLGYGDLDLKCEHRGPGEYLVIARIDDKTIVWSVPITE